MWITCDFSLFCGFFAFAKNVSNNNMYLIVIIYACISMCTHSDF